MATTSVSEFLAAKKAAKAEKEFPKTLAVSMALKLDWDGLGPVEKLELLFDWLGPLTDSKEKSAQATRRWEQGAFSALSNWKLRAIASRTGLTQAEVFAIWIKENLK